MRTRAVCLRLCCARLWTYQCGDVVLTAWNSGKSGTESPKSRISQAIRLLSNVRQGGIPYEHVFDGHPQVSLHASIDLCRKGQCSFPASAPIFKSPRGTNAEKPTVFTAGFSAYYLAMVVAAKSARRAICAASAAQCW